MKIYHMRIKNCYTPDADRLTKWDPQLQASKLTKQLTSATTNRKPFELQANPFHTIYVQVYFALPIFRRCRFAFWVAQSISIWTCTWTRVAAAAAVAFHRNVNKLSADPLAHTRTHLSGRECVGLRTWPMSRLAWPGFQLVWGPLLNPTISSNFGMHFIWKVWFY